MGKTTLNTETPTIHECLRCGHKWAGQRSIEKPKMCPNCKNAKWDKPRDPRYQFTTCPTCGRSVRAPNKKTEPKQTK